MAISTPPAKITIDLTQFTLAIACPQILELTLHFNSPSRRFYLGVIALVVTEMQRLGRITSIPLEGQHAVLAVLNDTVGEAAGSSAAGSLLSRIYQKWQQALPNLEAAPLFEVRGRKKGSGEGPGKAYPVTEAEQDRWATLFAYQGSHEHVRLKFALDTLGLTLEDVVLRYEDAVNGEAWDRFVARLTAQAGPRGQRAREADSSAAAERAPAPWWQRAWGVLRTSRRAAVLAAVVVFGVLAVAIGRSAVPHPAVASRAKMAFPLPAEPSIAVLPFANLSGDPQQEVLSRAMTEGITTALARVPQFFVIARASTAVYTGKAVSIPEVSEALGVRYVLEGSVQGAGDRVRVTAQLIDALTGTHVWAQQYDGDRTDLFALQDDLTLRILASVRATVLHPGGSGDRVAAKSYFRGPRGLECYSRWAEIDGYLVRWNVQDNNRGRRLAEELIAACPDNPQAYAQLAWAYHHDIGLGNTPSPERTLAQAVALAKQALAIEEACPNCHDIMNQLAVLAGDYATAIAEGQRSVALSPGSASSLQNYAATLTTVGRAAEALPLLEKAIRLSPFGPSSLFRDYGRAFRSLGRFAEAVAAYKKSLQIAPENQPALLQLAVTYMRMGRDADARAEVAAVLRANPTFSLAAYAKTIVGPNPADRARIVETLRTAGLH